MVESDNSEVLLKLEQVLHNQSEEVQRDILERFRDMTAESTLLEVVQKTNVITNRLAASAEGIAQDLEDLKTAIANGTVTPESLAALDASVANLHAMADTLEATDSAYPPPTPPEPVPAPDEPTEVPPVEEAPGTEPVVNP